MRSCVSPATATTTLRRSIWQCSFSLSHSALSCAHVCKEMIVIIGTCQTRYVPLHTHTRARTHCDKLVAARLSFNYRTTRLSKLQKPIKRPTDLVCERASTISRHDRRHVIPKENTQKRNFNPGQQRRQHAHAFTGNNVVIFFFLNKYSTTNFCHTPPPPTTTTTRTVLCSVCRIFGLMDFRTDTHTLWPPGHLHTPTHQARTHALTQAHALKKNA